MAVNKEKLEKSKAKAIKREKLTNWYMINMVYGFLGVILLNFIGGGYNYSGTMMYMNTVMIITAIVALLGSAVLFVLFFMKKGKNLERIKNYAIFTAVVGVVSLVIAFYAQIRNALIKFIPALSGINSGWRVWLWMALIGVYLVVAFIWYLIVYNMPEKK